MHFQKLALRGSDLRRKYSQDNLLREKGAGPERQKNLDRTRAQAKFQPVWSYKVFKNTSTLTLHPYWAGYGPFTLSHQSLATSYFKASLQALLVLPL
jgi:hypothetical protein